jgi:hypothetical protein
VDWDRHEEAADGLISLRPDLEPPLEWKLGRLAAQASQIQAFRAAAGERTTTVNGRH